MKTYICTKLIHAIPTKMVNGIPWPDGLPLPEIPEPEAAEVYNCKKNALSYPDIEEGYLFVTSPEDRYPTFMAKDEFEKTCRCAENMDFGDALKAVKQGKSVARKGWNGKNQFVELATCISYKGNAGEIVNCHHNNIGNKALAFIGTSGVQMGWLASQADMLAEDWYIVE